MPIEEEAFPSPPLGVGADRLLTAPSRRRQPPIPHYARPLTFPFFSFPIISKIVAD